MDILLQVSSELARGSGDSPRLMTVFTDVTANSGGKMHSRQFFDAVYYPLRQSVVKKIYEKHFQRNSDDKDGLTYEMFSHAVCRLEKNKECGFNNLLDAHKDENGMISFDSIKDILSVFLMQEGVVVCDTSVERLTKIILASGKEAYKIEELEQLIERWDGLKMRIRDILTSALFLAPLRQRPLALSLNQINKWPRRIFFFWCVIIYILSNLLCFAGIFVAGNAEHRINHGVAHLELARWNSSLHGILHRIENFKISINAGNITQIAPSQSVSLHAAINKELVNLHIFLAVAVGLKTIQVFLRKAPLCHYIRTQDLRLIKSVLYGVIFSLVIAEFALSLQSCHTIQISKEFVSKKASLDIPDSELTLLLMAVDALAFPVKYTCLAAYLLFELCIMGKVFTQLHLNVSDKLYCGFVMAHLIETSSFLKWSILILLLVATDHVVYRRCYKFRECIAKVKWCTTSGDLILSLHRDGITFRPGDFVLIAVEGMATNSVIPAWIISSSSKTSEVILLLDESHWQSQALIKYFERLHSVIRPANDKFIKDSLLRKNHDARLDPYTSKRLDNVLKDKWSKAREDTVIYFEQKNQLKSAKRLPNVISASIHTSLNVRVCGSFTGVQFDLCSHYKSIMLCVTPNSVGAIMAFLQENCHSAGSRSVTVVLTAPDLSGIEWFVEKLVQMEIQEGRKLAENRRFYFRIHLISSTSRRKRHFLLCSLAVATMASLCYDGDSNRQNVIQECRQIIQPALNTNGEMTKQMEGMFKDLGFLLCDNDFAYAAPYISTARLHGANVESRYF